MKTFHLTITDIAASIFEGEVRSLSCIGGLGDLTVLAGHMPFVTTLKAGVIRVIDGEGNTHEFPATGGILEVTAKKTTVLL